MMTFKAASSKPVSVLDEPGARDLILTAERQGALRFADRAVDRILALTSGHPYFIQLLCHILWNDIYDSRADAVATVELEAIEAAIPKALESGENIFEWIWDGLPSAERVVFAAIAEATREHPVVTEEQLIDLLQRHGIRILTRQLELAPATLVEWDMLRKTADGYIFFIELMRRWVLDRKPLPKVKDELNRVEPQAERLYRSGEFFYRQPDLESAKNQLRHALRANQNHLKARMLLGQILLEQNNPAEAVRELEEAYHYDEDAARYPLIRTLLQHGESLGRAGNDDGALKAYERVLAISPHEKVAQERRGDLVAAR